MKETKQEVENAIIKVGESLNIGDQVQILLKNIGIYSTKPSIFIHRQTQPILSN